MFNFQLNSEPLYPQLPSSHSPSLAHCSLLILSPDGLRETPEAMERLLYSSSPTPFKLRPKNSPFVHHRLCGFDSAKLGFLRPTRPESKRFGSFSCKRKNPSSSSSSCSSSASSNSLALPSSLVGSPAGSLPKSHFLKRVSVGTSDQQKV